MNLHTNGTEFYGNSSNLAFLSNLYSRAQNQAENKASNQPNAEPVRHGNFTQGNNAHQPLPSSPHGNFGSGRRRSMPSKARLSIVNLLCNADYTGHPSPESQDGHRSPSLGDGSRGNFNTGKGKVCFRMLSLKQLTEDPLKTSRKRLISWIWSSPVSSTVGNRKDLHPQLLHQQALYTSNA